MTNAQHTPDTSFAFICEWFIKAAKTAEASGKRDSAALWRDGLQHLDHLHGLNEELRNALAWLLPMAKGYAAEHPVGNNNAIVAHAADLLAKVDGGAV